MITIGFRSGAFCTCWSVEPGQGKYTKVRLSISRKNKETDEYEDEFSGFVMFIGEARAKAERLKERDRIRLGDVDVTRRYDKEKQKEYYNFKCFSFETEDEFGGAGPRHGSQAGSQASNNPVDSNPTEGFTAVETDELLPF